MKKLILLVLVNIVFCLSGFTQSTDAQLRAYTNTYIIPNASKSITATQMNTLLIDIIDSKQSLQSLHWTKLGNYIYQSTLTDLVGIGTNSPGATLDVHGKIWQTGTGESTFLGEGAGEHDDYSNNYSVYLGRAAGKYVDGGADNKNASNSIFIGYWTQASGESLTNEIVIGANAIGNGSNTATIGDDNITDIYMAEDGGANVHLNGIYDTEDDIGISGQLLSSTATGTNWINSSSAVPDSIRFKVDATNNSQVMFIVGKDTTWESFGHGHNQYFLKTGGNISGFATISEPGLILDNSDTAIDANAVFDADAIIYDSIAVHLDTLQSHNTRINSLGDGTVTSAGFNDGTGFTISGSPITESGSFTFAQDFSEFTDITESTGIKFVVTDPAEKEIAIGDVDLSDFNDDITSAYATTALDNLASVAINTSLLPDGAEGISLGSGTFPWSDLFLGDGGVINFNNGNVRITHTAGQLGFGAANLILTGYIGRDSDNYLGWGVDNSLAIKIGTAAHDIVSITDGDADNDKLVTQGYVDDAADGATRALKNQIQSKKIFEYKLDFTPPSTFYSGAQSFGSGLTENEKYIICIFNDSDGGVYLHHIVMRYNKGTQRIDTLKITTTNGYYNDHHKKPACIISKAGTLLVAIEQLPGDSGHNGPISVFRWADLDDLSTYTQTTVGNSTTERLAYPFLFEVGSDVHLEVRRYDATPPYRSYSKSTDDGVNWGTVTDYISYGDSDYWIYAGQVRNNIKNRDNVILGIIPQNDASNANCYQYVTFLKTDFTSFYELDGTSLGSSVTGAELESALSWGNSTKNTSLYFTRTFKIFDDYIWSIGSIGTRTSGGINVTSMQIFKVNANTGTVTTGSAFPDIFSSTTLPEGLLFKMGEDIIYKQVYGGNIFYYEFDSDMNGVTLILTETGDYNDFVTTNVYNDLSMDYDDTSGILRVFRMY